ncbi:hypothetical protein AMECASPLE_001371 [Ameca splendens]|uniref:Uncharacterized protein n=1 Tax=Ameca splendens TaxID=208324 RepID=A0ABV0XXU5_9TELE
MEASDVPGRNKIRGSKTKRVYSPNQKKFSLSEEQDVNLKQAPIVFFLNLPHAGRTRRAQRLCVEICELLSPGAIRTSLPQRLPGNSGCISDVKRNQPVKATLQIVLSLCHRKQSQTTSMCEIYREAMRMWVK